MISPRFAVELGISHGDEGYPGFQTGIRYVTIYNIYIYINKHDVNICIHIYIYVCNIWRYPKDMRMGLVLHQPQTNDKHLLNMVDFTNNSGGLTLNK